MPKWVGPWDADEELENPKFEKIHRDKKSVEEADFDRIRGNKKRNRPAREPRPEKE